MAELTDHTLSTAADLLRTGQLSPVDYLRACLDRIDRYDPQLNAFISTDREAAMQAARVAEREIAAGQWRGPLHGVPVALKDIFDVAGQCTSNHSRVRMDHVAAADAFVVTKLRQAGAVLIGKTALHEFATGGPSFDLPWPPARNPWKPTHHPGGSSSGSGVAVAAGMVPVALGTDTGGSVRNPATVCGVTGMKPTYGVVSRSGVFPLAFSLDHVGPLTRTVRDNAMVLQVLLGRDGADPSSVGHPAPDMTGSLYRGMKGLRIGVIDEFGAAANPEIASAFEQACAMFDLLGAELVPLRLSPLDTYVGCGRLILQAEGFAVHEHWLRTRLNDYGMRGSTRLLPGALLTATDYIRAQQQRTLLLREFADAMAGVDAAICVSSLEMPCAIDDETEIDRTYDRQARTPFNLTGSPAISVPMGFSQAGLPIGLQVVGKAFDEAMVYRVANDYQNATGWHLRRPELHDKDTPHAST
ncbi:Asp-tRNA(Asn)/Glu-tRNA(Gln) amidotransferase GatCAB subunit A [Caenimonas sp. SL110]|uniref:Asp-tRNA(Asn)/Glu-tRNA(Gln) amidotransferase GatCAB subunit A n=1 Tax=Caenimonas sp. SL110 TaxID=1450524 RepID=UPI0006543EE4|nr:Asp-tRNA(Asn)/Glu-tRNA(Gln) amidotransferase GatCAB subunit A [Caenimonas sp. SL110]